MKDKHLYYKEFKQRGPAHHVHLMRFMRDTIMVGKQERMITIPSRENASNFYAALAKFDKDRKFYTVESGGQMASRGEYYDFPEVSEDQLRDIAEMRAWLRKFGQSKMAKPNDTFKVPLESSREDAIEWKPMTVATYGPSPFDSTRPFMISDIRSLARDAWYYNRLIKMAQFHGAAHSLAMMIRLLADRIPFEFVFHNDVPNEMPDELDYVKYIILYELKLPMVITHLGSTIEEYMYWKALLMSDLARWCTNEWKIKPFKMFLKTFFFKLNLKEDESPDTPVVPPGVKHVDILQYLGMQAAQSRARAALNPLPTPSDISIPSPENWEKASEGKRILRVFDALPVHDLTNDDNIRMIQRRGWMRNPNELEFGRHGCLLCPYASIAYYWQLQHKYPELFRICKERVALGNKRSNTSFTFIAPSKMYPKIRTTFRGRPVIDYTKPPYNYPEGQPPL